jgi:hypothetical protein
VQGYLVRKDTTGKDADHPLETRAETALPGVPYTTMRLAVKPIDQSCANSGSKAAAPDLPAATGSGGKPEKKKKP